MVAVDAVDVGVEGAARLIHQYRAAWAAAGRDPADAQVGVHAHLYVGPGSTADAVEYWRPYQQSYLSWVLRDVAGMTGPLPAHLAELATPIAQAVCGSAEDVAADLIQRMEAAGGIDLLTVQSDQGGLPHAEVSASYRRFVAGVLPRVREAVAP